MEYCVVISIVVSYKFFCWQGICEKCIALCESSSPPDLSLDLSVKPTSENLAEQLPNVRRRHRSAVTHSSSELQQPVKLVSQDDMQLRQLAIEHLGNYIKSCSHISW